MRTAPRAKLLLVDDEPAVLRALGRLLGERFEVDTADNAERAFRMALDGPYDVVLSDHDLPGESGAWLLEELARVRPAIWRVLTSGRDVVGIESLLKRGVLHRFLKKPARREELLEAVLR
jgi:DNA-binding NtrC family response regulator